MTQPFSFSCTHASSRHAVWSIAVNRKGIWTNVPYRDLHKNRSKQFHCCHPASGAVCGHCAPLSHPTCHHDAGFPYHFSLLQVCWMTWQRQRVMPCCKVSGKALSSGDRRFRGTLVLSSEGDPGSPTPTRKCTIESQDTLHGICGKQRSLTRENHGTCDDSHK